jgi:coenzyme PQQ biosynthesis protein PqqD
LNASASRVVELCDGTRTISAIIDALAETAPADRERIAADVVELLENLHARTLVELAR